MKTRESQMSIEESLFGPAKNQVQLQEQKVFVAFVREMWKKYRLVQDERGRPSMIGYPRQPRITNVEAHLLTEIGEWLVERFNDKKEIDWGNLKMEHIDQANLNLIAWYQERELHGSGKKPRLGA